MEKKVLDEHIFSKFVLTKLTLVSSRQLFAGKAQITLYTSTVTTNSAPNSKHSAHKLWTDIGCLFNGGRNTSMADELMSISIASNHV